MNNVRQMILVALMSTSSLSWAEGTTQAGAVTAIQFYEGHTGILIRHTNMMDPDQCGRADWFILPDTHSHFKQAYATLLTANVTNKKISINVSGCLQGIPQIRHITVVSD
jgi:hypothetical protein